MLRLTIISVCLSAAIGCGAKGPRATRFTRDSAGVTIVEGGPADSGSKVAWALSDTPTVSIGGSASTDPATHYRILFAARRLSNGTVVALVIPEVELRFFDSTGVHVKTKPLKGSGPGELPDFPASLTVLPGDTLLIEGTGRSKQVWYSPTGQYIREEQIDVERIDKLKVTDPHCPTRIAPDRSWLGCRLEAGETTGRHAGLNRPLFRLYRVPFAADTAIPLGGYRGLGQHLVDMGGGDLQGGPIGLSPIGLTAIGGTPLRIAIMINPEYSIELWMPDGKLDRIIRREDRRRPPTDQDRKMFSDWLESTPALKDRLAAEVKLPDLMPAGMGLFIAPSGEVIVERSQYHHSDRFVDVFRPDGNFLSEIHLPAGFRIQEVGADYLLGTRNDANDVEVIEVYRIER